MDSYSSYRDESRGRDDRGDSFYARRSPDRDRRDRRRSRSPGPNIDRYEPRERGPRRDDRDRDDRRRMTSPPANIDRYVPGQDAGTPAVLQNPIVDPSKLPYQVGFSYYSEWWRMNEKIKEEKERVKTGRRREPERPRNPQEAQEEREKEKEKIQTAYDSYKEELQAKMARTFVSEHKKEQWFKERYVAEVRDPFRAKLNETRKGAYSQWEQDLESGTFDDFSLEGVPKSESNGAAASNDKEEGETTANEIMGVGDLVPSAGADIRDENQFQPTLLIKTIAPHVSRTNLESFCKEHLGEEEGGYKWLSLSDPNPSKRYHRIGWVMLHPSSEAAAPIDRPEMKDEDEDGDKPIGSPAPVSTADKALEAINGKTVKDEVRGDFVCHVGVHNPPTHPRKKALWDLFSAPERVDKDLEQIRRLVNHFEDSFGSDFQAILKVEEKVESLKNAGRLQPAVPPTPAKPKKEEDRDDDEAMDAETGAPDEEEEEGAIEEEADVDDEDLLAKKKELDLLIEYLRRVFNFCFFCVFESDSVHELTRKCPAGHLRRPRTNMSDTARDVARASANGDPFPEKKRTEAAEEGEIDAPEGDKKFRGNASKGEVQLLRAFNWVKTFEDKIKQILEPQAVDVRKLGGKPVDEAIEDETMKHVKQEDEHKFRCKVPECTKLFKEEHFWKKHVEKRHSDWVESLKEEFELINSYVLDPAHIAPSRTDANSNGHFPQPNGQGSTGTPRGFNLSNFSMNGMMPGLPPNFAMQMLPGMQGYNPMGDDRSGPIRRGGMQGNRGQFRSGPYDRRGGRDGGRRMGGSRWGDGAGGAGGGPREAVQGRSLKSYEDLDHVAGGGGGELNY